MSLMNLIPSKKENAILLFVPEKMFIFNIRLHIGNIFVINAYSFSRSFLLFSFPSFLNDRTNKLVDHASWKWLSTVFPIERRVCKLHVGVTLILLKIEVYLFWFLSLKINESGKQAIPLIHLVSPNVIGQCFYLVKDLFPKVAVLKYGMLFGRFLYHR